MTTTISNRTSEIEEIVSPVPAIVFAQEPDRRGRNHSVTPLIEEDTVADTLSSSSTTEMQPKKAHRNSLAAFAERLRSRSRSHSRHRPASAEDDLDMDRTATQSSTTSTQSTSSRNSSKSRSGSRKSSVELGEDGPYADVVRAQNEFMERLRAEQEKNNVTHNADGIPIPPRSSPSSRSGSRSGSRRSSITHILGLDKPLLAF